MPAAKDLLGAVANAGSGRNIESASGRGMAVIPHGLRYFASSLPVVAVASTMFDPTITLGNILQIITIAAGGLSALFIFVVKINSVFNRITLLEKRMEFMESQNTLPVGRRHTMRHPGSKGHGE